jgi:Chromo (CHRromatin Organisation MOdifier) domain
MIEWTFFVLETLAEDSVDAESDGDSSEESQVEKIIGSRWNKRKKCTEYLVKWKNYPEDENSWELPESLANATDKLEEFVRNLQVTT